ncbi:hypothetical protein [Streptomyces mirabilis]|uniref:hypothetical protein n=1 Tax=Streptomyces mirabilis TaxID=68239 RepID=UPI003680A862
MTIQRNGDYVLWDDWRNPDEDEVDLTASRFEAQEYQREVERATADRSWERPARTVARLLEQDLRERTDRVARWECELGAVSASERLAEQLVAADPPSRRSPRRLNRLRQATSAVSDNVCPVVM